MPVPMITEPEPGNSITSTTTPRSNPRNQKGALFVVKGGYKGTQTLKKKEIRAYSGSETKCPQRFRHGGPEKWTDHIRRS